MDYIKNNIMIIFNKDIRMKIKEYAKEIVNLQDMILRMKLLNAIAKLKLMYHCYQK